MGCAMSMPNPRCWMDISVDGNLIGRLVIEVREDVVPKTAKNFIGLCTGEYGNSYKGSLIYRVVPGFMAQPMSTSILQPPKEIFMLPGGEPNFVLKGGDCGKSIYGKKFEDENFKLLHNQVGVVSMANNGPHTNGTQFFIVLGDCSSLDGRHVVFGRVVSGKDVLDQLEALGSKEGTTSKQIKITDCGQL
ncbi:hypothetical protein MPTK1_2g03940 [Marchantia polymorpha subsp. ruderalis]|nr:hypothetical protein MARPO_0031s0050 [Marchantia polymorpha]BBN01015.1 hypothetical protein Mp_2g03940 [Marchantia polymorpha subsp. ruderalis]|eukprot:PTQ42064.1 hypothetical protein MARPO_0031s0050 [Marchantia polymorpha]